MAVYQQFINDYNGKQGVSFDGIPANAGQCVQSVAFYVRDYLHLPVYYADAVYWYTNFQNSPLKNNFTRVANNPNDPSQLPQPGDIIIWNGSLPNSGGAGHIAVYLSAFSGGFVSFDSNWGGKYCHQVSHNWSYVLGWLHPNNQSTNNASAGDEPMISDADNEYGRWNKLFYQIRGRNAGRDEFRNAAVGRNWLAAMEILSDNAEADNATHAQEVGQQAINDNWPGQIGGLQTQLTTAQTVANQLNEALTKVQGDDTATKAQLKEAIDKATALTAELTTANDKLVDTQKQQAQDKEAGDSFLRRLGQFISKYIPGK